MTAPQPDLHRQQGGLRWPLTLLMVLVLLFVGLLTLLMFTPAGAIGMVLERTGSDVRLLSPAGRIHRGSGQVLLGAGDLGRLTWQFEPGQLLRGRLGYRFQLVAPSHQATGRATISPRRIAIEDIEGALEEAGLRDLLAPYDIRPSGNLTLTAGRVEGERNRLIAVHGDAHWTGGFVRYFLGDQGWTVEFPPLDARLRLEQEQPVLVVFDPAGEELLDANLGLDGWAHLRLRYRFIAMAGFPWPDAPPPDTILIELSEQVF
ncbi:MAG: hypothetical protein EA417_11300 [Gammaproteobacteria bacterium]|nr:MAG: hypothetical protein EA417_11300 [Gammaproteobacteria bacterium]